MDSNGALRVPIVHWLFARSPAPKPIPGRKESLPAELLQLAALTAPAALERLHSRPGGLDAMELAERRAAFGVNRVAHEERETLLAQFLRRLLNPLNILLLTLATVSVFMGDREAAAMIFAMVALSLTLSIAQERKSSAAAQRLRAMVHTTAMVVRSDQGASTDPARPPEPICRRA